MGLPAKSGASATALIFLMGAALCTCFQELPASVERSTPPTLAPAKTVPSLPSAGETASASTRPFEKDFPPFTCSQVSPPSVERNTVPWAPANTVESDGKLGETSTDMNR